jgi:hypothetical protein
MSLYMMPVSPVTTRCLSRVRSIPLETECAVVLARKLKSRKSQERKKWRWLTGGEMKYEEVMKERNDGNLVRERGEEMK